MSTALTARTSASLVIFGFRPDATAQDVRSALGCCGARIGDACTDLKVDMVAMPGDSGEVYALVQEVPDRLLAYRLSDGLNMRRFHGRHLTSWVPVMAWS